MSKFTTIEDLARLPKSMHPRIWSTDVAKLKRWGEIKQELAVLECELLEVEAVLQREATALIAACNEAEQE